MAKQIIPPVFFFLVGLGFSYSLAKRTSHSASWIAVGVSSAILAAFAVLFGGGDDLYRAVAGRDIALIFLLAGFYRLMADGVAALLAGGIAGTLVVMFQKRRSLPATPRVPD
jgi:uncharacterized membrane protein YjjP (DUF1212 family)